VCGLMGDFWTEQVCMSVWADEWFWTEQVCMSVWADG